MREVVVYVNEPFSVSPASIELPENAKEEKWSVRFEVVDPVSQLAVSPRRHGMNDAGGESGRESRMR